MSRQVTLIRPPKGTPDIDGTFGRFIVEGGLFECVSGELPYRDNKSYISCVQLGTYVVKVIDSPSHGRVYELQNVKGRTHCQIHSASYCGDTACGKKSELLGCITLGKKVVADGNGQRILTGSKATIHAFYELMAGEDFILTIIEGAK